MIVWGGSDGNRSYADGAAYDPATRVWTKLAAAPISARAGADYVWTGSLLFIWGSYADRTDSVADGAVYDPATRRWTTLPPPPFSGLGPSAAVWTGSAVVLLTSPRAEPSGGGPEVVYAQSYDPARNAWTPLPKLGLPPNHGLGELSAVAVGGHVFTWAMWSHTVAKPDSSSTMSGVDAYQLDTGTTQWSRNTLAPKGYSVLGPLWTGREILVPTLSIWCGGCAGAPSINASGARMDPRSSTLQSLPHGPVSDLNASSCGPAPWCWAWGRMPRWAARDRATLLRGILARTRGPGCPARHWRVKIRSPSGPEQACSSGGRYMPQVGPRRRQPPDCISASDSGDEPAHRYVRIDSESQACRRRMPASGTSSGDRNALYPLDTRKINTVAAEGSGYGSLAIIGSRVAGGTNLRPVVVRLPGRLAACKGTGSCPRSRNSRSLKSRSNTLIGRISPVWSLIVATCHARRQESARRAAGGRVGRGARRGLPGRCRRPVGSRRRWTG
jgi:hypothetical protein